MKPRPPIQESSQRDFFREHGEFVIPPLLTRDYLAANRLGVDFPKRFRAKVAKQDGGCWVWQASALADGYGHIARGAPYRGMITAHTASWIIHRGPIPPGLCVLHNCPDGDCPACVNPAHLWLGTHKQNMRDKIAKGRTTGGLRGVSHKLSAELATQIRDLARHRIFPQKQIASDYAVSKETLKQIVRGETWRAA